jgi:short-subunit dehydrogenase
MNIDGKIVVVTGASSGIGAATAKALSARGASVILLARNEERLHSVCGEIHAKGGQARFHSVDLNNPDAIHDVATSILTDIGPPDILINNAGAGRWISVEETNSQELVQMMSLPYFAAFNLTREFLPAMKGKQSGTIVNVTSVASRIVWPGAAAYTAARWAMEGFNKALRAELYWTNINVMLAMFGTVSSDYWEHNPASLERLPKVAKMARVLTPETVAESIVKGIENNKRLVLKPEIFRFILLLNTLFPGNTESLMCKTGWRN